MSLEGGRSLLEEQLQVKHWLKPSWNRSSLKDLHCGAELIPVGKPDSSLTVPACLKKKNYKYCHVNWRAGP